MDFAKGEPAVCEITYFTEKKKVRTGVPRHHAFEGADEGVDLDIQSVLHEVQDVLGAFERFGTIGRAGQIARGRKISWEEIEAWVDGLG